MNNFQQPIIILCSCPANNKVAQELAHVLVETKLAACVNILPEMKSIYSWEGQIKKEKNRLLLIKSTRARYAEVEELLIKLHPHDVPEIIMLDIEHGSNDYIQWLTGEVSGKGL